jgi:hypothetical protein
MVVSEYDKDFGGDPGAAARHVSFSFSVSSCYVLRVLIDCSVSCDSGNETPRRKDWPARRCSERRSVFSVSRSSVYYWSVARLYRVVQSLIEDGFRPDYYYRWWDYIQLKYQSSRT